jgi:hypothetical protein
VAFNKHLQELYKPTHGAILVNPVRTTARKNVPQTMWIWSGQELICASRLQGLRNQATYRVEELSPTHAVLRGGDNRPIKLSPLSKVAELFRLPYARTYHNAQGLGFDRVRLWDCESKYFSAERLVTGISRCRCSDALDFGVM